MATLSISIENEIQTEVQTEVQTKIQTKTSYSCERCGKKFTQKSHYQAHQNRKKLCENNSEKMNEIVSQEVQKAVSKVHEYYLPNLKKMISENGLDQEWLSIMSKEMNTFQDLYQFLQSYLPDSIIEWLKEPWEGKDKQESLLRLFAGLGCIEKLKDYQICKGNFNLRTIQKQSSIYDVFFDTYSGKLISLKDKGDASDLTGIHADHEKHLLLTTSKNLNKMTVGKLDIDKILTNFQPYVQENYTMTLCFCIRRQEDFQLMKKNMETTNKQLKLILDKPDTLIIDWEDLNQAFHVFRKHYGKIGFDNLLKEHKNKQASTFYLKMHQQLGVLKTLTLKNQGSVEKILWGHIPRSGKSYIMAGCIYEDSLSKSICNYLIITTAPKETIEQYLQVCNHEQFQEFQICALHGQNKEPQLGNKNIIICSKQFLQSKIDGKDQKEKMLSIPWLKKMKFEMRFIDESHNGGTTELAKKTLMTYGCESFTVQITATYMKPIHDYDIPKEHWILWDLEDVQLCKNVYNLQNQQRLIEKHGSEFDSLLKQYSQSNIQNTYAQYPELWLLTHQIKEDIVSSLLEQTKENQNQYGWSSESCFLLKQGVQKNKETGDQEFLIKNEFQNEQETLNMWYSIFGKKNNFGIPDKDFPDSLVFMKRIEQICMNPHISSRHMGNSEDPLVIMAFLPQKYIHETSSATIDLLEKYNVIPNYEIVSINSKITQNPKQTIEHAKIVAKNSGKKGVLVLSGKQCSLGVSIHYCDVVLLLNNNTSFDMIYQMMFRCMTEGPHKKCGFVIDLNIHRVIETTIMDYAALLHPNKHPQEGMKYILQERLIHLNGDHWKPCFENNITNLDSLCQQVYSIYSANTESALNHVLNRLKFKEIYLNKEDQSLMNQLFQKHHSGKKQSNKQKDSSSSNSTGTTDVDTILKGIEKISLEENSVNSHSSSAESLSNENDTVQKKVNYMDIFKHMIPLICLLTIHHESTSFIEMFKYIQENNMLFEIFIQQLKNWWGKSIEHNMMENFVLLYVKYIRDDKETNQIIRTVKELFMKNIKKPKVLSQLIDKYLIPQELEKKENAEISTPFSLRHDMLQKIPDIFWTSVHKVLEPCVGKGGFLIDILDAFMKGLESSIPNEDERYRTIVEECLYFSDINMTNIFISKLLIDPFNQFCLNVYEGNTLDINIQKIWNIDGFDAVIGNPPYQNKNGGSNGTFWDKFVSFAIENTKQDGYICYVHPSGWRNVDGKFKSIQKSIFDYNLLYLEIHNEADGIQIFHAETRYDWYVLQKNKDYTTTQVLFEDKQLRSIDVSKLEFIPNGQFDVVQKLIAQENEEQCVVLHSHSFYDPRKKWMSESKSAEHKYPCVYTINSSHEIKHRYSSENLGHIGQPKLMWSNGRIKSIGSVIDKDGSYGLTCFAYGIVDKVENLDSIKKAFDSKKFRTLMEYCAVGQLTVNFKIIRLFRKDFWKEFIEK